MLKKRRFLEKDKGWQVMFNDFLNHALSWMLVQASDEYLIEEMAKNFDNLVSGKIAESIFSMILIDLGEVIKPGRLYPLKKVYGIDWMSNVNAAC